MTDVKAALIKLLSDEYKIPVILQGSLSPSDAYPASFFTIWNPETTDGDHFDNDAALFVWRFSINYYSTDATSVNTMLPAVRSLLRSNGWIVDGMGYDIPTDEISHTGRALDVIFMQRNSDW